MDGEDGPILGVFYPISLGEFPQTGVMTFGARCEEFSEERVREHIRSIQYEHVLEHLIPFGDTPIAD